jgi:hypothetical protein
MANDLINPFQRFDDKKEVALAGGGLRVRVNRTSTLGTAFSDSALTVAQSVNPYRLDIGGRVQGDLRWSGKRTVEVYNARDELIRTLNDVVTLVDTSTFAINAASVAAMVANTTLIVGDIVETQSYNASQNEGGARYEVVAAATGTADGFIYIDLATHQAKLLDQERNKNFYVAGAVGDATADDSVPVQAVLTVGGNIECANGSFLVDGLTLSLAARIYGNGTLLHGAFTTTDMLTLTGADLVLMFDGITVDGNSTNQTATAAIASIDSAITATSGNVSLISFNGVTFQNGAEYNVRALATDVAFPVLYGFSECNFLGGLEATDAPFLPACISIGNAANALIEDCYFDFLTTPAVIGGRIAIETESTLGALTNPGYLTVSGCTFNKMGANADASNIRAAIYAQDVSRLQVGNNRFLTPTSGAVVFGAEVDVVDITENVVDALVGTNVHAGIASVVTARTTPGNHWKIEANELIGLTANAIVIDGASGGVDAAFVSIIGNIIDSPTAAAILVHNVDGLTIGENEINMASLAGVNAIEINTDGVTGLVDISNNELVNVGSTTGVAIISAVTCTGAIFNIDGNAIENGVDGITITGVATSAYITNNTMQEVVGDLVTVQNLTTCRINGNSYAGTAPATYADNDGSITDLLVGENLWLTVDDTILNIVGAAIPITAHYHEITATTTITSATFAADVIGWMVTLKATVSVTVNDSATINLASSYSMTVTDTLVLVWDGSAFQEVSRSVN